MIKEYVFNCQFHAFSLLPRLFLAAAMGGIIGLEREAKNRPAGFRTYMLVALGATMAMILNQYIDYMLTGPWTEYITYTSRPDISRLGAQVVNGVGFIGAGIILVTSRQEIKGLTTAAGLWASACIGLSIGAGFYFCAVVGMLLIIMCMSLFTVLERRAMSNSRNMHVHIEFDSYENIGNVSSSIQAMNIKVFNIDVTSKPTKEENTNICSAYLELFLDHKEPHERTLVKLSAIQGVRVVSEVGI